MWILYNGVTFGALEDSVDYLYFHWKYKYSTGFIISGDLFKLTPCENLRCTEVKENGIDKSAFDDMEVCSTIHYSTKTSNIQAGGL